MGTRRHGTASFFIPYTIQNILLHGGALTLSTPPSQSTLVLTLILGANPIIGTARFRRVDVIIAS